MADAKRQQAEGNFLMRFMSRFITTLAARSMILTKSVENAAVAINYQWVKPHDD